MEINSAFLRLKLPNFILDELGSGLTANSTVDVVSHIGITATVVNSTINLPAPSDGRSGRDMRVTNTGLFSFTMHGKIIGTENYADFSFDSGVWHSEAPTKTHSVGFWRDVIATQRSLPDGSIDDMTIGIVHNGPVHMGADNVAGIQGFSHLAISSFAGSNTQISQLIQTKIPADSNIMPNIRLKGYGWGDTQLIDIDMAMYIFAFPTNTIREHVWQNKGTIAPSQIRAGFISGFLALEISWPVAKDFYRFEVSAYCDGNGPHQAEWFQDWPITVGLFPGTVVTPTIVAQKFVAGNAPAADFWREVGTLGLPDGITDSGDAIIRSGQVRISVGIAGDSGLKLDDLRSRQSVQGAAGDAQVTDNNMTAVGVDTFGKFRLSNALSVPDLRTTNIDPQLYPAGASYAFKTLAAIGIPNQLPSAGTFASLHTIRRFANGADFSGGQVYQEATTDVGRKFYRVSTSITSWGNWREYETQGGRGLAELGNLVAGVVPDGYTAAQYYNGNWQPTITLPSNNGVRDGEIFTYRNIANLDTTILVNNTNMTTPLLVTQVMGGASFVMVNGKWNLISENPGAKPRNGDLKDSLQANDHNGWYRLNGRLVSSLPAVAQASWLALFPATTNLVTANGKYKTDDGTPLGGTSGAAGNQITLAQAQLPNVSLTATAIGGHTHTTGGADAGAGPQAATGTANIGSFGLMQRSSGGNNTVATADTSVGEPNIIVAPNNHFHTTDNQGAHSHAVPLGGAGSPIGIKPNSLSIATFVYLG